MINNMNTEHLSKTKYELLNRIKSCENELIEITTKVGENNKLEIFDNELINKYIFLKNQLSILTYNFLY